MNPSKLSKSILQHIEQEKITPRSRLYFTLKNIGFWALFAAAMVAGAISFALILYASQNTDFAVVEFVEETEVIKHWLTLLPIIWILLVGVAIGIGMVGLKHTKRGYRIALITLVGSNILGSVVLGGGLYAAGGGEIIEEALEESLEGYKGVRKKHQRFWGNPEETGRLSGRIQSIDEDSKTLTLEGPYGRTWEVDYSQAEFPDTVKIEIGKPFKMRGKVEAEGQFKPQGIKPAHRQENMQRRVQDHLRRNPELRRQFEQHLNPETKAQLDILKQNGERPSHEMREQMRQEVQQNTTEQERHELRENTEKSMQNERRKHTPNRPKPVEFDPL